MRMALDTGVAGSDIVHACRIQNVSARWVIQMLTTGPVAFFASDVPFCDLFGVDVVVDGVAAIARRPRGPLHVVRRVEWFPPVRALRDEIRPPDSMGNIPLRRFRKIIVPSFREITLLPKAAVNQRHIILRELRDGIRRKIWNDRVWMFARIAHDIRHGRLSPVFVDLRVALQTGLRAHIMSRTCRGPLLRLFLPAELTKVADVKNQLPNVVVLFVVWFGPSWHAGQTHAIPNDVADLSVREVLGLRQTQVWNFGI